MTRLLAKKYLARYKSSSKEGLWHRVFQDRKTGRITCTCPSFFYRAECRHARRQTDLILEKGYRL